MAVTANLYRSAASEFFAIDYDGSQVVAHLMTSSYSPSVSDANFSTISANEVSGNGYAGQLLSLGSVSESAGTTTIDYTTDAVFTASGGNIVAHYYVIRAATAFQQLLVYGLLDDTAGGTDVTIPDGETLTITFSGSGLYTVS